MYTYYVVAITDKAYVSFIYTLDFKMDSIERIQKVTALIKKNGYSNVCITFFSQLDNPSLDNTVNLLPTSVVERFAFVFNSNTVLAVDFDHTLCHSVWPGTGAPNTQLIQKLKRVQAAGCHLVLWTCREGRLLEDAVQWCREQGLEFEAINDNPEWLKQEYGNNCRKIGAHYFLDDRALPIEWFLQMEF